MATAITLTMAAAIMRATITLTMAAAVIYGSGRWLRGISDLVSLVHFGPSGGRAETIGQQLTNNERVGFVNCWSTVEQQLANS